MMASDIEVAHNAAKALLQETVTGLVDANKPPGGVPGAPRLFFPNGIDLIEVSVKLQTVVEVQLTISGSSKKSLDSSLDKTSTAAVT